MKYLTIMRVWRTGVSDLHIDLFDMETGFSFEVVLHFINYAQRNRAFDTIWNEHAKTQSFTKWFKLFRSVKPLERR